jgi:hypothetical protein
VIVQADGAIVVAGAAMGDQDSEYSQEWMVLRFNPDGTPDTTFGQKGVEHITFGTSNSEALPFAAAATPDGGFVVEGLFFGSPESFLNTLIFVEYGFASPDSPTQPMHTAPVTRTPSTAASDAVFASIAATSGNAVAQGQSANQTADPLTLLTASPSATSALPVPSGSQSEAVARISGGGGETIAAEDVLGIAGESDRVGNLVFLGTADGSTE